ncbi:MAG: hypothetical protein MR021_00690 [Clostridiales bacterium]|nr:hypothetical protein [Clostridiales bacterium]
MNRPPRTRTFRMRVHALSLHKKLLISYLALSALCLVPFALISSIEASQLSERSTLYSAQQAMDQAADSIEFRMKSLRRANYTFAYSEETVNIFSKNPEANSLTEQLSDRDTLENMLRRIRLAYPDTVTAVHLYMNDQFLYVSPRSESFWPMKVCATRRGFRPCKPPAASAITFPPRGTCRPTSYRSPT